jgi:hypothetical protein
MDGWHKTLEEEAHMVLDAVAMMQQKHGHHEVPFKQTTMAVFIKLSIMDIFLLYKMLFKSEEENEKNVMARTLATLIAEFIDDVGKMIGKPLTEATKDHLENHDIQAAMKNVRSWYNTIKVKYESMRNIRNIVSAHKDRNVVLQLATNEKLNLDEFHILIIVNFQSFIGAFRKYERLLINCINQNK